MPSPLDLTAPLDLDEVRTRSQASVEALGGRDEHAALAASADDVPALLAEVEALRARVADAADLARMWQAEAAARGEDTDTLFTAGAAQMLLHRLGLPVRA